MRIRTNPPFNFACVWAGERARGVWEWAERGTGQVHPPSPTPFLSLLLGVSDGHFQHQLRRDLKELGVVAIGLKQEWQDIEAASWGFPTLLHADLQPDVVRSGHQAFQTQRRWGGAEAPDLAHQHPLPLEALSHTHHLLYQVLPDVTR